ARPSSTPDRAPPELHTLSLHDALPISGPGSSDVVIQGNRCEGIRAQCLMAEGPDVDNGSGEGESENWLFDGNYCDSHAEAQSVRSEEHTSELQSRENLVCRLLLEKKKE